MDNGRPKRARVPFRVDALDAVGRERIVKLFVRGNRIVVLSPPGEGFTLTKKGALQMSAFLREASYQADNDPDEGPDAVTTAADTTGTTTATISRRPGDVSRHPRETSRPSVFTHGEPPE